MRHAESKKNVVYYPWIPEEEHDILTAERQRQALALGHFLHEKGILGILSFHAGRTRETAKAIGQFMGLKAGYEVDQAIASWRGGKSLDGYQISW